MGLVAPPAGTGMVRRVRGIAIVVAIVVVLLAIGFGLAQARHAAVRRDLDARRVPPRPRHPHHRARRDGAARQTQAERGAGEGLSRARRRVASGRRPCRSHRSRAATTTSCSTWTAACGSATSRPSGRPTRSPRCASRARASRSSPTTGATAPRSRCASSGASGSRPRVEEVVTVGGALQFHLAERYGHDRARPSSSARQRSSPRRARGAADRERHGVRVPGRGRRRRRARRLRLRGAARGRAGRDRGAPSWWRRRATPSSPCPTVPGPVPAPCSRRSRPPRASWRRTSASRRRRSSTLRWTGSGRAARSRRRPARDRPGGRARAPGSTARSCSPARRRRCRRTAPTGAIAVRDSLADLVLRLACRSVPRRSAPHREPERRRRPGAARSCPRVEAALRGHGTEFRSSDDRASTTRRSSPAARSRPGDVAVAMGGDGLAGAVAGALRGSQGTLGRAPRRARQRLRAQARHPARRPRGRARSLARGERAHRRRRRGRRPHVPRHRVSFGFDSDVHGSRTTTRSRSARLVYLYATLRALARVEAGPLRARRRRRRAATVRRLLRRRRATPASTAAGCTSRPTPSSTTACSTSSHRATSRKRALPARPAARLQRHARARSGRRPSLHGARGRLRRRPPVPVYADGDPIADLPATIRVVPGRAAGAGAA